MADPSGDAPARVPARVAGSDNSRMLEEDETKPASCPEYTREKALARIVPKFGAHPGLGTFQCAECRHVVTIEVEE
jgi:hypothetical protein